MKQCVRRLVVIVLCALLLVSCSQGIVVKTEGKALEISENDYWNVMRLLLQDNLKNETSDNSLYQGNKIFDEYRENISKMQLAFDEEDRESYYERELVIMNTAVGLGYEEEAYLGKQSDFSLDNILYISEDKDEAVKYDLWYQAIEKYSAEKNISMEEYAKKYFYPVYSCVFANIFLQNYFYQNIYDGEFINDAPLYSKEDGEKAVEFLKEYDSYVDELTIQ